MAVAESVAKRTPKRPAGPAGKTAPAPVPAKEAVWVFESSPGARFRRSAAEIALKYHGAKEDKYNGPAGNSYAIQTRDEKNKLLPWDVLKEHVQKFREIAEAHPNRKFRILPSPYSKSEADHTKFAELFRNVPKNCELPGRWLELLGRLNTARIILLDANVGAPDSDDRKRAFDLYFTANEALWNVDNIEIVSFGAPRTVVHNDKYAKSRGYAHRIISVDPKRYRKHASQACELLAVAYATKIVCFNDPMGTSVGTQMGTLQLAVGAGLQVDEELIQ